MAKITLSTLDDVYSEFKKEEVLPSTEYSFSHPKKTKNKAIQMSIGRIWINLVLPNDYPDLIDEPVNKGVLNFITKRLYELYDAEKAADALSTLSREVFKMSTMCPVTFSRDALILPDDIKEKKAKEITSKLSPEEFAPALKKLAGEYMDRIGETGLGDIVHSKASGKLSDMDFAILTLAKGPVMDIEGNVSEPILSSLMDGYTGSEYYDAAAEARRGYYIRAVGTAEPGYLARQVIFANVNTNLAKKEDCGTKKYFHLFVRESLFKMLVGRYYFNERTGKLTQITEKMKKRLLNKVVLLRSPLFCKSKDGICATCYGELSKKLDTTKIGLIAGSVINEAGVEGYAMKARHQASQVNLKAVDFTQDLIHI